MKKIIICILCCVFLFGNSVLANTSGEKLQDLGIINGDSNGNLLEDEPLTRAQLAVIVCQLNKVSDEAKRFTESLGFEDVTSNAWYGPYVNYCKKQGWLNGTTETTYSPEGLVTEEMVAIVLERILGYDPSWGDATAYAKQIGIYVEVKEPSTILRSEVFDYMYQTLFQVPKGNEAMLYKTLGLDLHDAYAFMTGLKLNASLNFEEIDIYGNSLTTDIQKTMDKESEYEFYIDYTDDRNREFEFRYNDTFLIQEEEGRLVKTLEWSKLGKASKEYDITGITMDYIILSEVQDDYYMKDYLYDWDGKEIKLPTTEPNRFCYTFEDGYVIVDMMDANYNYSEDTYLYNTRTETIEENIYPFKNIQKISEDIWLYSYKDEDEFEVYKIQNQTTGKSNVFNLKDNSYESQYQLNWDYGEAYGTVLYYVSPEEDSNVEIQGSSLIDLQGEEIVKTSLYIEEPAFLEGNAYIVQERDNFYGIMDEKGMLILEPIYEAIYSFDGNYVKVEEQDGGSFYLSSDFTKLTEDVYKEEISVYNPLPNGLMLVTSGSYYTTPKLIDASGNVIKTFDNSSDAVYMKSLNVILSRYGIYSMEGQALEISDEYNLFYDFDGDFITAIKDDQTYIIDVDGNIVLGPYEGRIEFE